MMDQTGLMDATDSLQKLYGPIEPLAVTDPLGVLSYPVPYSTILTILEQENPFSVVGLAQGVEIGCCAVDAGDGLLRCLVVDSIAVYKVLSSWMH